MRLRIAAAGDVHAQADSPRLHVLAAAFAAAASDADVLLLAGDLTERGRPEDADALAAVCRTLPVPVIAVLGNRDHACGRAAEVAAALDRAGVTVLDGSHCTVDVAGVELGIAGTTGCAGGFADAPLEGVAPPLRARLEARAVAEAAALAAGLRAVARCAARVALLHYAPTRDTLAGEPEHLHPRLGCGRLGEALAEHPPHVVLHAHAHRGRFRGRAAGVPAYNVSAAVVGREVCRIELALAPAGVP